MNLKAGDFSYDKDPNYQVSFNVVADGYMQITPIEITIDIIGNNDAFTYGGSEHTVTGYTLNAGTYAYTENDFTFTGSASASRTEEGTENMHLAAIQFENKNANYSRVNFSITDGYVTIVPVNEVVVTIVGNTDTFDYDGQSHSVTGYKVRSISNTLYKESDFTFTRTAKTEGRAAGTYEMGLAEDQFVNNNGNFAKVKFEVIDDKLTINPISVMVKINGNKDTKAYNGEEQEVKGYQIASISSERALMLELIQ